MKRKLGRRNGSILLLVLIVVPMLTLAAYSFTHWMRAEARGGVSHLRTTQAIWIAHSGIEHAQAFLSDPANLDPSTIDLENNPSVFAKILVAPAFRQSEGAFSIVAPSLIANTTEIRYGLLNESAKIPLHRKRVLFKGKIEEQAERLMLLPNMTPELADCLLDWIDKDDEPRPSGAEADYYLSLANPYSPRNAPPRTLGELLLVRGVTPWHLYGEDANLDGMLNPNENDGDRSWPADDADGELDPGWYPFLTIYSAASDLDPAGENKIDLNGDLGSHKDNLVELFGQEWFDFVDAWKKEKPGRKLRSVSQLIDAKVEVNDNQAQGNPLQGLLGGNAPGGNPQAGGKKKTLESPWTSQNIDQYLDDALSYLTVDSNSKTPGLVRGRIDVTRAPVPVVRALPGLSEASANAIASAANGRAAGDRSPAWLLADGVVSLEEFQAIETLVTTQNRVFHVESVGYFNVPGPVARVEAVIDASQSPARVLYRRELVPVGSAYPHSTLVGGGTSMLESTSGP